MIPPIAPSGETLPPLLAQRVQSELQPGETLVWTGRPVPGLATRPLWLFTIVGIVMMVPMMIVLAITAIGVLLGGAPALFGLCFLFPTGFLGLLGLSFALMPLWARSAANKTVYSLTDRRTIVCQQNLFSLNVQSFGPAELARMYRRELRDGMGDLIFLDSAWTNGRGSQQLRTVGFQAIRDVHDVETLVRATLLRE